MSKGISKTSWDPVYVAVELPIYRDPVANFGYYLVKFYTMVGSSVTR
jgi:hypothetical protein